MTTTSAMRWARRLNIRNAPIGPSTSAALSSTSPPASVGTAGSSVCRPIATSDEPDQVLGGLVQPERPQHPIRPRHARHAELPSIAERAEDRGEARAGASGRRPVVRDPALRERRVTSCRACHPCRRRACRRRPAPAGSGLSATSASVVSTMAAIDAAFCSAARVTLAGSTMPALTRSVSSPVAALSPVAPSSASTRCTHTEPSSPAFSAMRRAGVDERLPHRAGAGRLVARERLDDGLDGRTGPEQGGAATGDHTLLDRRTSGRDGVLDAVLLLLELDLGGRADLDDGDAAGQLGEALLELLAVPVRVGVLDLGLDLVDPALDVLGRRHHRRRWWCCPW